jgi:hypothetical protein
MYKFFHQHNEQNICDFIHTKEPKRIYAEDLLILGQGAMGSPNGVDVSLIMKDRPVGSSVHLLPVACLNCQEVSQIERRQSVIERGMINGATQVLTLLGPIVGITPERIDEALEEMFPHSRVRNNDRVRQSFRFLKSKLRKTMRSD